MKMRKVFFAAVVCICSLPGVFAQEKTLRVDYIFSGTHDSADISLGRLYSYDGWAGRRVNMDYLCLKGNGQISMTDQKTGKLLYIQSFSSLFQEWQTTEEAVNIRKAFENTFLLPMPQSKSVIKVELFDLYGNVSSSMSHMVDPQDILIKCQTDVPAPHRYLLQSGSPREKIDVAIVAEGYTATQAEVFYEHAQAAVDAILAHEPFASYKDRFNFVAVALESKDSGVSVPHNGIWKNTALDSNYDTFYAQRYLTTSNVSKLHDALYGIPYEHIIILANDDTYGGGGIFNSYTLTTSRHQAFAPVVVHEFGHSFAGLADEYYYDDQYVEYYYSEIEPWEQNITTLCEFETKWKDMLPETAVIPTPVKDDVWEMIADGVSSDSLVGVYEGGGYQSKGVYRPFPDCRMKTNQAECFCPVCQRAIARLIEFYTE